MVSRPLMWLGVAFLLAAHAVATSRAEEPEEIFSGPQVGETLEGFQVRELLGERAGREFDPVAAAGEQPLLLVFVHAANRPSIGVTRAVMHYAAKQRESGLHAAVVFLHADATAAEALVKRMAHALPQDVPVTLSLDGAEGPGSYGLNRLVTVTALVAKDRKAVANFALVQPSLAADAPKIAAAVADVLGKKERPTLDDLAVSAVRADRDAELRPLLAPVIRKDASADEVAAAAAKVEAYVAERPAAKTAVGDIARRIVDSGKLADYGTPPAQEALKRWAKDFR